MIMKLFTNENNTAALKILVASKYGGNNVDIQFASAEDSRFKAPYTFPVLEFESGNVLFLSNPSARYLFPPKQETEIVTDQWLEWEATILQPLVASFLSNPAKPDTFVQTRMVEEFSMIEATLIAKTFLTGDSMSVADISVWSCLYPIGTDPKFSEVLFSTSKQTKLWFQNLAAESLVKEAEVALKLKAGTAFYQTSARLPSFATTEQKSRPTLQAATSLESPVKEAPVSEAELQAAAETWLNGAARQAQPKPRVTPVLPQEGARNVLITSALPYVNNVPHLGNIIGCVLSADVFARFSRLCGHTTLYICGTDEYGTATETKALEEGLTPQQICDKYFKIHEDIYRWFDISFDYFGRTTTPEQTEICQEMFLQLHKNGYMCTESMEQLLCVNCNRYLADRFVEGTCPRCGYEDARGDQCDGCGHLINATELLKPRCKVCQGVPVIRNSEQYFLDLPKIEPKLQTWMQESSPGWSHNARVIGQTWIRDGLRPRCITRDLKWGIPVPLPGFEEKVFYVWFDAPVGYMSMTKCYTTAWECWWRPSQTAPVTLYQFMAKDNVPFHAVMFPAALLGTRLNYVTVSHIMATEYLNYEDGKFSKSRGVGVFGTDARDTGIPQDVWRFYLLYVRPEGQDSSFSWADLATKNNSELLNNLGNFVNRALVFADKNFGGRVPKMSLEGPDLTLLALVTRELRAYIAAVGKAKLRDGIRHILAIGRHGNQYMQAQQPWVLHKGSDADRARAGTVIGLCCNLACLLSVLLHPYMPGTSATLRGQLAAPEGTLLIGEEVFVLLPAGHQLGTPVPLFNKIEPDHVEKLKQKFAGQQLKAASPKVGQNMSVQGTTVASLEAAVAEQGELVRKVKASGVAKSEWQPHVAKLLELKRQLTEAQAAAETSKGEQTRLMPAGMVACLEAAVAEQGELLRKVKASGAAKTEWQPHVAKLLDLKRQLTEAQAGAGCPKVAENGFTLEGIIASLKDAVAKQGALVRMVKASGVAKSEWQPHVAKLLDLKNQLMEAQATNKK